MSIEKEGREGQKRERLSFQELTFLFDNLTLQTHILALNKIKQEINRDSIFFSTL